jgi:hypothetical protein
MIQMSSSALSVPDNEPPSYEDEPPSYEELFGGSTAAELKATGGVCASCGSLRLSNNVVFCHNCGTKRQVI